MDKQIIESEGNNIEVIDEREVLGKPFRIYGDAENPLFLAKDVAAWIEHSNPRMMLQAVDDAEKVVRNAYTLGGNQEMWFLTECGLYEVLMQSRKPIAKEFKKQVKAILKQIRKHGMYMTPERMIESLRRPEGLMVLLQELLDEQLANAELKAQVSELQPKAEFADAVTASDNSVSFGEMAKILRQNGLPYGRTRMCEALRQDGFLIKQECVDYNTPTQFAMERGVFYHCKHIKDIPGGFPATTNVTRVTGRGQQLLLQHFKRKQSQASARESSA